MQLVQSPALYPARCAVSQKDENARGFVDLETAVDGCRVYVVAEVAEEIGRLVGMVPAIDLETAQMEAEVAASERDNANAKVAELENQLDAVHILRRAGFNAEKKRGPKAQGGER